MFAPERTAASWVLGINGTENRVKGMLPRSLSDCQRMCVSAQSRSCKTGSIACAQTRPAQERLDEELSTGQEPPARENLTKVGWANPAQLSSRSLLARPPLQSSTRINMFFQAKPPACRGLAAVYSGANSLASALPLPNGRDPVRNQSHFNPELATDSPLTLQNRTFLLCRE